MRPAASEWPASCARRSSRSRRASEGPAEDETPPRPDDGELITLSYLGDRLEVHMHRSDGRTLRFAGQAQPPDDEDDDHIEVNGVRVRRQDAAAEIDRQLREGQERLRWRSNPPSEYRCEDGDR